MVHNLWNVCHTSSCIFIAHTFSTAPVRTLTTNNPATCWDLTRSFLSHSSSDCYNFKCFILCEVYIFIFCTTAAFRFVYSSRFVQFTTPGRSTCVYGDRATSRLCVDSVCNGTALTIQVWMQVMLLYAFIKWYGERWYSNVKALLAMQPIWHHLYTLSIRDFPSSSFHLCTTFI